MYELSRILLQSIGPKGARFEDVVLDLRDRDANPARDSVLYLENGGGKSVLLTLLFSAVLPGRKNVLGANSNTKTLENFVATGDTSHVVMEWRRADAGELLLTGKVYEWRGRQHSSDSQNLREAWYTVRPVEGVLTLDTLPTLGERDGATRKRNFASYKEKLEEAGRAHPELDLVWTDVQRKWVKHLDELGLDPELFKYQREMNADEGDADEVFAFSTDEAFIDFLLGAVTDSEGPTELATNVDAYADKLRERERLQLEHRFVEGALERLRPLAAAESRRAAAAADLAGAQRQAENIQAQFAAAASAATADHEQLGERAAEQETRARSLDTRGRELQEQLRELRRRAAQFRLDAATAAFEAAETKRDETKAELAAWRATQPLAAHRAAAARARMLTEQFAAAEQEAAPLIEQHADAARRYAGALMALIDEARQASQFAASAAESAVKAEKAERTAAGSAREDAGRLLAEAKSAQKELDAAEAERERLISLKLLARGQNAEDALAALDERQSAVQQREQKAVDRLTAIDGQSQTLGEAAAEASTRESRATDQATRLEGEHEKFHRRGEQLTDSERLHELAAVERVDVWSMGEPLQKALAEAAAATERDIVLVELDAADDRRAAGALQDTGRLPAARDAQAAIQVLRAANIPAHAGWDFLAESLRPDEREAALRCLPELVGGVILTNPAHRERAEAALIQAELKPTSVIALGDAGELSALSQGRERFIVEPNAALYDEEAGEAELELRQERLRLVNERRRELEERGRHDHKLRRELEALLGECPPGRLEELAAAAAGQRQLASEAHTAAEDARREREALLEERPKQDAAARDAQEELRRLAGARPQLEAFREQSAQDRELRESIRRCGEGAKAADDQAAGHTRAGDAYAGAAREATRTADDHSRRGERLTDELQKVEGAGENVERERSGGPIEELRGAYDLAKRLLAKATTDSELAAEHRHAQEVEADAHASLEEFEAHTRARAEELLAQAPDRPARRDGERRAERAANAAEERRANCLSEKNQREEELKRATPKDESGRGPRAQLTDDLIPSNLDEAIAFQSRLDAERTKAQEDRIAAAAAATQAREHAAKAESRSQVIGAHAEAVKNALASTGVQLGAEAQPAIAAAFAGDLDAAAALMRDTATALREADDALDQAQAEVRDGAEKLTRFASADEFEAMAGGNLRERLARDESTTLARRAGQLMQPLEDRLAEVAKELASIEQHRRALLQRLLALVQDALATLRQASRASRLPAELGDWSGKPFVRIDFEVPDSEEVLLERLGEVLSAAVQTGSDRDGMTLLLRGARAAAEPKGFRVTVLKPNAVLRDERVPVTAMAQFSGGQRLTAAIALYCTLASMRAASRGRQKSSAGVLILDNPIGKASANYLIDIQLKIAERVGVQLVYTTGVNDLNALSQFTCTVRMRNDLDMRTGLQRIRVSDEVRRELLRARSGEDPNAYIDAVRVMRESAEEPTPA